MKIRIILALAAFSVGLVFSVNVFAQDKPTTPGTYPQVVTGDDQIKVKKYDKTEKMKEDYNKASAYCRKYHKNTTENCSAAGGGFIACNNQDACDLKDKLLDVIKAPDDCEDKKGLELSRCIADDKTERDGNVRTAISEATKNGACRGKSLQEIATDFKERNTAANTSVKENKTSLNDAKDKLNKKKEDIQRENKNISDEIAKTETTIAGILENKANMEMDAQDRVTAMKNDLEDQKTLIQSLMDQQEEVELRYNSAIQAADQKCIDEGVAESKLKTGALLQSIGAGTNKKRSISDVLTTTSQGGVEGSKSLAFRTITAECMARISTRNAKINAAAVKKIELNKLSANLKQAVAKAARIQTDMNSFTARTQAKSKILADKSQMLQRQGQEAKGMNTKMLELYQKQAAELESRKNEEEAEYALSVLEAETSKIVKDNVRGGNTSEQDTDALKSVIAAAGYASDKASDSDSTEIKELYDKFNKFGVDCSVTPASGKPKSADRPKGS